MRGPNAVAVLWPALEHGHVERRELALAMGELEQEIAAKLEASLATTPSGQYLIEHGQMPPRDDPLIEETLTTLLEFQRTLGEVAVRLAHEIDKLRGG